MLLVTHRALHLMWKLAVPQVNSQMRTSTLPWGTRWPHVLQRPRSEARGRGNGELVAIKQEMSDSGKSRVKKPIMNKVPLPATPVVKQQSVPPPVVMQEQFEEPRDKRKLIVKTKEEARKRRRPLSVAARAMFGRVQ